MSETEKLTFEQTLKLKDALLRKEQGEALKRGSTPITFNESMSLGHFGPETVYGLNVIHMQNSLIDLLVTIPEDGEEIEENILNEFVEGIGRGSGSIGARRLSETLETIGQLGQSMLLNQHTPLQPERLDLNARHRDRNKSD